VRRVWLRGGIADGGQALGPGAPLGGLLATGVQPVTRTAPPQSAREDARGKVLTTSPLRDVDHEVAGCTSTSHDREIARSIGAISTSQIRPHPAFFVEVEFRVASAD
jgi:hypothetical protein